MKDIAIIGMGDSLDHGFHVPTPENLSFESPIGFITKPVVKSVDSLLDILDKVDKINWEKYIKIVNNHE